MPVVNGAYRRPNLRNDKINYRDGWFFVTFQVADNKSILGAIVGDRCVLNELGEKVKGLIETLQDFNPEVFVDCFVVMPNHVHVVLKLARGATPSHPKNMGATPSHPENMGATASHPNIILESGGVDPRAPHPENNLGRIIGKLKSLAAREYRLLKDAGRAPDIGTKLWQSNYWEKIVTKHEQLEAIRRYIAENPQRWSIDRFGPVTTYSRGNLKLLDEPFDAYVASEGRGERGATAPHPENMGATPSHPEIILESGRGATPSRPENGPRSPRPIISTFTSPQEREMLARLLAQGRRFIAVYPGGIPKILPRAIEESVNAGRALLLSPVEPGTGVNKQRAIWCNEYVIRRAVKVWCGGIRPGGTLESILKGLRERSRAESGGAGAPYSSEHGVTSVRARDDDRQSTGRRSSEHGVIFGKGKGCL